MRIAIRVGVGASCLLGCSNGVLDVGSSDAGDPRDASLEVSPAVTEFSAAAVERAGNLCKLTNPPNLGWTSYNQSVLRSDLTGGWLLCHWQSTVLADKRSFQFTADGHFYTLGDDGDGGLGRVSLGDEAGPIGSQGTYTFLDTHEDASVPGGPAVYVAGNGMRWFHPEFTTDGAGYLMTMTFLTDASQDTCVRLDPP